MLASTILVFLLAFFKLPESLGNLQGQLLAALSSVLSLDTLWEFCSVSAGAGLLAFVDLCTEDFQIVISHAELRFDIDFCIIFC